MVQQERDRRGPEPGGDPERPGHLSPRAAARQRAARDLIAHEQHLQAKVDKTLVRPGFRERVEELVAALWREPAVVVRLDERLGLGFAVSGRRLDGTVKGKNLVGRFFWNIGRCVAGVVINLFSLFGGGGVGNPFKREIRVTGPADAMALELVDKLRPATGPWLACSPSHLAVVDTGATYLDPADAPEPRILWHAQHSGRPRLNFRTSTITWPDGSTFRFPLHGRTEVRHLRDYHEFPDVTPSTPDADRRSATDRCGDDGTATVT